MYWSWPTRRPTATHVQYIGEPFAQLSRHCDIPQSVKMSDPSDADSSHEFLKIYSLSGDQLVELLEENGFSAGVCQIFTGHIAS